MRTASLRLAIASLVLVLLAAAPALAQNEELPLGSDMPMSNEALPRAGGGELTLSDAQGSNGTVVVFWSNNCPWVDKYEDRFFDLVEGYGSQGIGFVLINSNDATAFPKESLDESATRAGKYPAPYVRDPGSRIARAFGAARTPHVFVFDGDGALAYVGTLDDSPGDPGNVQNRYLADALDAVVAGDPVATSRTKAFGCTIKFE